ncbi:hypothetical protein ZWY2020_026026 [Hordeum vulgare]|nr:hypothetical protein ZWY2020_026026 [Hordeum vulgare]
MPSSSPSWSELPRDILALVMDRLPSADGRRPSFLSAACSWLLFWSACYWLLLALLHIVARFRAARSSHRHTADFGAMYRSWRMADSVDRARFRAAFHGYCMVEAACRSLPAAAYEHIPVLRRRPPWIVLSYPYFITSSDDSSSCGRRLPYLPETMATDDWIALRRLLVDDVHTYLLHNHFADMTVPPPELDALTRDDSRLFEVRKVLMWSTNPWRHLVWPPWSELPLDILGLVIDRVASSLTSSLPRFRMAATSEQYTTHSVDLTTDSRDRAHFRAAYRSWCTTDSADHARFRMAYRANCTVGAVCRSWRGTSREHLPCPPRRLPWIVLSYCYFGKCSESSDTCVRRLPSLPKNSTCIGSTDDWIAIRRVIVDNGQETHRYLLHNPFSDTTVPLPELDALIGNNVSLLFEVRKVLMRTTPDDIVAVMTNNYNYPIILVRPGKGVWLPRPRSAPFIYIIDIVFIGDILYGITKAEDLISLDIAFGVDGTPIITRAKRVIRNPSKANDFSKVWSNVDFLRVSSYPSKLDHGYDLWSDVDEKYHKYVAKNKGEQGGETLNGDDDEDHARYLRTTNNTGNHTIRGGIQYDESDELLITTWQIVESLGKLLMVRWKLHHPLHGRYYTRSAYVFEANINVGAWVPVKDGLCGQALFISRYYCKSVRASGDVEKDAVYFADTGEVLNMRSRTTSQPQRDFFFREATWLFPPDPIV